MHCPICNLVVAPQDPERVEEKDQVFHKSCKARRDALVQRAQKQTDQWFWGHDGVKFPAPVVLQ